MHIKKNSDGTLFISICMITNEFRNRIMLNLHKLSITHPFWENRKSEAYLLFRGGDEEKFKDKLKGVLLSFISIFAALQTVNAVCT